MVAVQRIRIRQQRIQLEETLYFETCGSPKVDGQLRKDEIQKLKDLDTQQQMFNKQRTQHHSIVKASFVVSEEIAKHSKSFSEGEFIKECLVDVASIICPEKRKKYLFVETYCCPTDRNDG
jgi:hypothetical protein